MIYFLSLVVLAGVVTANNERINHVGRILPPIPSVSSPLLFQTPQADAVLQSLQIFPPEHCWNEDISMLSPDANSDNVMSKIYTDLFQASNRKLRFNYDMNYVIIPDHQSKIPITWFNYPDDSDPSPYPIPSNLPIEGWPLALSYIEDRTETLSQFQTDCEGDCHAMFLNPSGGLWEIYTARRNGTTNKWEGSNGAWFNYSSDFFRGLNQVDECCTTAGVPWSNSKDDGLTSADASGLSVFAGVVRYDETERGLIEHAVRCQLRCGTGPVYPATHRADQYATGSSHPCTQSANDAQLGMRFRLKPSYNISTTWSPESQTLARALKQFGCILTDWASFFSISVSPDSRWNQTVPAGDGPGPFDDIVGLSGTPGLQITDFELVTTSVNSGPRSTGKPTLIAEVDKKVSSLNTTITAKVTTSMAATLSFYTYQDRVTPPKYESAGMAVFNPATSVNIASAVTNEDHTIAVNLPVKGTYYLMFALNDHVHAPVYDVVMVTASPNSAVRIGNGWMWLGLVVLSLLRL